MIPFGQSTAMPTLNFSSGWEDVAEVSHTSQWEMESASCTTTATSMEVHGFEMLEHYIQNHSHDTVQVLMNYIRSFIIMITPVNPSMTCPPEHPRFQETVEGLQVLNKRSRCVPTATWLSLRTTDHSFAYSEDHGIHDYTEGRCHVYVVWSWTTSLTPSWLQALSRTAYTQKCARDKGRYNITIELYRNRDLCVCISYRVICCHSFLSRKCSEYRTAIVHSPSRHRNRKVGGRPRYHNRIEAIS